MKRLLPTALVVAVLVLVGLVTLVVGTTVVCNGSGFSCGG